VIGTPGLRITGRGADPGGQCRDRQLPGTAYGGIARDRYNASKDWDERRRVERALARLAHPAVAGSWTVGYRRYALLAKR